MRPIDGAGRWVRMEEHTPKLRRVETDKERAERLLALEAQSNDKRRAEDDALDAMVRRSIALHGA